MALRRLCNRGARAVFLDRHGLARPPGGATTSPALLGLIHDLGFVQLDSINTVARAHDLILFSRRPQYRPTHLKRLYERDGGLFEHWTHDAAVIPRAFYPWWDLRRRRDAEKLRHQWRNWRRDGFEDQLTAVLRQVERDGPVTSSEVGRKEMRGSGGWWDWHPSKTALEYLWRSGALAVVGREGFKKRYDLTERVIETHLSDPAKAPDTAQTIEWCCAGALDRLGFATPAEITAFWGHLTLPEVKAWCDKRRANGDITEVEIETSDGRLHRSLSWAELPDITAAAPVVAPSKRLRVLSPFDPALRDRKRAAMLFGFDYRIEIFTPEAKRKYGYYVFPILEGDRIVARIDMKARRGDDTLHVQALWPEVSIKWGQQRQRALEAELARLTRLAGVQSVSFANGWLRGGGKPIGTNPA